MIAKHFYRPSSRQLPGALLAFAALMFASSALAAGGAVYRCHTLGGALAFQDKPCNAANNTREAKSDSEGEVVVAAPPPQLQSGTPAIEHYTRYLDFVAKDRREQQASDDAETARLRAQAEADRAASSSAKSQSSCAATGPSGECLPGSLYYEPPYAFLPSQNRRVIRDRDPNRPPTPAAPSVSSGPRPLGPNQPPRSLSTTDPRSDVLSLSPPPSPRP